MPRPRKSSDTKQSRQVSFRLTDQEYAELEAVAAKAGLRASDLARRLTKRGQRRLVIHVTKRHDPAFIAQIRAMGLNLNQLTKRSHLRGYVSPGVNELCAEIQRVVLGAVNDEELT